LRIEIRPAKARAGLDKLWGGALIELKSLPRANIWSAQLSPQFRHASNYGCVL